MKNSPFAFLKKPLALLVLCSVGSLLFLCLTIPFMGMADMNSNSPCGMNHLTELCPIALHEQLGFWQKILVPFSSTMGLLLAFVVLVVLTIVFQDTATIEARQRLRLFHYHAEASAPLIDYLEQQFSQGVLHPKIY